MQPFDPVATSQDISATYKRYLRTTFWAKDAKVRDHFRDALDNRFQLTQGPLLQATAPYVLGKSIANLVEQGVLHPGFRELDPEAFPIERPLYVHQERAIKKLTDSRNLIVATGTGSGKTECFLFPIIDHLLRERDAATLSQAGVRAMLLYPMNALANDQMKRIRDLLRPFPEITFGRFIGDTERHNRDALARHQMSFGQDPLSNELISRDQIRESPPHILLTNYAMLEYLLLRPEDTKLFDGPSGRHWRFIAMDEVHVYDGAQGAEIAMLLRRVRDRVNQSKRGEILYVGTSATLGKGESDFGSLAEYAQALFDEHVEYIRSDPLRQDIIGPKRRTLLHGEATWSLAASQLLDLEELVDSHRDVRELYELFTTMGITAPPGLKLGELLGYALSTESSLLRLQEILEAGSASIDTIAKAIFDEGECFNLTTALVKVGMVATSPMHGAPLIPARYHFLLRALEGAFICLSSEHPFEESKLFLAPGVHCPACLRFKTVSRLFELGTCRKCGASYLVGTTEDEGRVRTFARASGHSTNLEYLLIDGLRDAEDEDEDEGCSVSDDASAADTDTRTLCTQCGCLSEGAKAECGCGDMHALAVIHAHNARGADELHKCIACSGRSNVGIVLRYSTGQDAPVAVIATSLYQQIPESNETNHRQLLGQGRKLLSFADSRKDAAFFAPYLERTYSRAVERSLLWRIVSQDTTIENRFEDLTLPIRLQAERDLVLDPDVGAQSNFSHTRTWLMREVLATDRRQSIDGVGLAEITVAIPRGVAAPSALLSLGFTENECIDLARVLLDTLRIQAAVSLPNDVDISDPIFAPRNVVSNIRLEQTAYGILAWVPKKGDNRRLDYLRKVLQIKEIETDAVRLLSDLWSQWLTKPTSPWHKVFVNSEIRGEGQVLALRHEWLTFLPATKEHPSYICDTCRQVWWRSVQAVCPSFHCKGTLRVTEDEDLADNHYRRLYQSLKTIGMSISEHTGQLESRYASEIQQDFIDGRINVLSCSTTFELGVDVGEVVAVLMKNVPPSPANYVQRAGRAGRRTASAALVVTFAQRRNHDLHYFQNPWAMVDGTVTTPIISIDNPQIVRRHLHAVAFAAYERMIVESGGTWHKSVKEFFVPLAEETTAPVDDFLEWLRGRPQDLGDALTRITPANIDVDRAETLGVANWNWVDALALSSEEHESYGWLSRATNEVREELRETLDAISEKDERLVEARKADQGPRVRAILFQMQALEREKDTISGRRLIDYLARRVVIPKYGFPVDVVTLDVIRHGDAGSTKVDLSRDLRLGITEFAPGSQIVADKAIWEPIGVRIPPSKALLTSTWAECADCNAFWTVRGAEPGDCPTCGSGQLAGSRQFFKPEFGFLGKRSDQKPGEARPRNNGFSDVHFSDFAAPPPEFQEMSLSAHKIRYRFSKQGQITVINGGNGGRGFRVCFTCGCTEVAPINVRRTGISKETHQRPNVSGSQCSSHFRVMHFGHDYFTDVVEIDLDFDMSWGEARSCLYALLSATPRIGITRGDVNGTLRSTGSGRPPSLILIDAVPGGAGHAHRIQERLGDLVDSAIRIVRDCQCGADSSCYSCLRSYENQRFHFELVRGDALRILETISGP